MSATPAPEHPVPRRVDPIREGVLFAVALAFGLLGVPLLIWLAGHRTLGPYTRGEDPRALGPGALFGDYFHGLAHGWVAYWAVALGPVLLLALVRLWLALLRLNPRE